MTNRLADQLDLLGPFDGINEIKDRIIGDCRSLNAEHVRSAAELPTNHAVRILLIQACIVPYVWECHEGTIFYDVPGLKMEKAVNEIDSFAADFFREYDRVVRKERRVSVNGKRTIHTITDPLTGQSFDLVWNAT